MTIQDQISRQGVQEVLHFTTNRGLVGSLATGSLLSRRRLPREKYLIHILHPNAKTRSEEKPYFDKSRDWLDYINLSISEINTSFFRFSGGWPHNQGLWWVILAFDPDIMTHAGVYFATTNNAYEHCLRGEGEKGLRALFGPVIRRKGAWSAHRGARAANLPSCEQAEVLYPKSLSLDHLRCIYVRTGEDGDRVRGFLREFERTGIEVIVNEQKFFGKPN